MKEDIEMMVKLIEHMRKGQQPNEPVNPRNWVELDDLLWGAKTFLKLAIKTLEKEGDKHD